MSRTARHRTRRRALLAGTALPTAAVLLPAPAHAEAAADYTIAVGTGARGPAIDDTMYGVFFDDVPGCGAHVHVHVPAELGDVHEDRPALTPTGPSGLVSGSHE
ncbi:hypothetical protein [Streptomyces sp. NPDC085937]|uniref:hypothetical protein n=1 Tax=Streptomyces sp. NPDC085937 TaxID=3365742 RepID=UPI0037CF6AF9